MVDGSTNSGILQSLRASAAEFDGNILIPRSLACRIPSIIRIVVNRSCHWPSMMPTATILGALLGYEWVPQREAALCALGLLPSSFYFSLLDFVSPGWLLWSAWSDIVQLGRPKSPFAIDAQLVR